MLHLGFGFAVFCSPVIGSDVLHRLPKTIDRIPRKVSYTQEPFPNGGLAHHGKYALRCFP
jgi:hypothetical protein